MVPSYGSGGTFAGPNPNPTMPMRTGLQDQGGFMQMLQQMLQNPQIMQSLMPQLQQLQGMIGNQGPRMSTMPIPHQPGPMGIGQGNRSMLSGQNPGLGHSMHPSMGGGMQHSNPTMRPSMPGLQPSSGFQRPNAPMNPQGMTSMQPTTSGFMNQERQMNQPYQRFGM